MPFDVEYIHRNGWFWLVGRLPFIRASAWPGFWWREAQIGAVLGLRLKIMMYQGQDRYNI